MNSRADPVTRILWWIARMAGLAALVPLMLIAFGEHGTGRRVRASGFISRSSHCPVGEVSLRRRGARAKHSSGEKGAPKCNLGTRRKVPHQRREREQLPDRSVHRFDQLVHDRDEHPRRRRRDHALLFHRRPAAALLPLAPELTGQGRIAAATAASKKACHVERSETSLTIFLLLARPR